MESIQAPHEKLTDDEIEKVINNFYAEMDRTRQMFILKTDAFFKGIPDSAADEDLKEKSLQLHGMVYNLKEYILKRLEDLDYLTTKLKKHTCPEKFSIMKISIKDMSDMMIEADKKQTEETNERKN